MRYVDTVDEARALVEEVLPGAMPPTVVIQKQSFADFGDWTDQGEPVVVEG
jgi:hypothetical protein